MVQKIKLGMVGGGQGAFIGAVHRIASRIDDRYELVAGAFSSDAERALASGKELGIPEDRNYKNFQVGYIALTKKGETGSYSIQNGFSMTQYDKTGNVTYDSPYFHKQG